MGGMGGGVPQAVAVALLLSGFLPPAWCCGPSLATGGEQPQLAWCYTGWLTWAFGIGVNQF